MANPFLNDEALKKASTTRWAAPEPGTALDADGRRSGQHLEVGGDDRRRHDHRQLACW